MLCNKSACFYNAKCAERFCNEQWIETYICDCEKSKNLPDIEDNRLVWGLVSFIDTCDNYTLGHSERVGYYSLKLAEALEIPEDDMKILKYASVLHDIGKIKIPSSILNKSTKLTAKEFEIVRSHPQIGYEILAEVDYLIQCRGILLQHHERVDGKGYPNRLGGESIHLMAKIITVADSFDAMTSIRAYRKTPLTTEDALEQLYNGKGSQYDGYVVDVFIGVIEMEGLNWPNGVAIR